MSITIVGLGPGDGRYLTREAWDVLQSVSDKLYVRTAQHPAVDDLPEGVTVQSFDSLYEASTEFETVYQEIIDTVVELGQSGDVVYAVPGHPHVGEATVLGIEALAKATQTPIRIVAGLSFVEPMLTDLGLDGLDGIQIFDALTVAQYLHPPLNVDAPLLLGQVYSPMVASELKLALMALYGPMHTVKLLHGAGTNEAVIESVPLFEIDRSEHIRNLTSLFVPARTEVGSLGNFAETIAFLRSPNGCPWDREQTAQSMLPSFLEEMAEVADAIERDDVDELRDELGDLLLHIVFQAQLASEGDEFTLTDVIAGIEAKIRRRHPHVWGDVNAESADDVVKTWDEIKREEKGDAQPSSILDNLPLTLPSMMRAQKMQKRAAKVGFDWPDISDVWAKLDEELAELHEAIDQKQGRERISAELGDILFVLANVARWLKVDADAALRSTNLKFIRRFQIIEQTLKARSLAFEEMTLAELDAIWDEAKIVEND